MRMSSPGRSGTTVLALVLLAAPLPAQHEGHVMPGMQLDSAPPRGHVMAQAIPFARMGRYGVASIGPPIGTLAGGASPSHSH